MWKTLKLIDIVDIEIGKTPSRNNPKYWDKNKKGSNVWLSIRDMSKANGLYIDDSKEYISDEGAKLFKEVPKNTLIMSFKLSIGKLAITKINLRTNEAIAAFKIKDAALVSNKYLYYFLSSMNWDRLAGYDIKVKGKTLNKAKLKKILITLPPLAEQQRIVNKLDVSFAGVDKLIKISFDKLNYIDEVKNSILNNKLGNNLIKLYKACDLIKRGISPKYLETSGICVINQKCIRNHKIDFSKARRHNINLKKVPEERIIRKGDVLINSTGQGTLGRVAQVRKEPLEKTTVDSHITIVRPKQNLFNPNFFGNSLIKIEKQLQAAGEGTSGQTELSRSRLENEFFVPYIKSIDEQKKIALLLDLIFEKTFILKNLTTKIIENQKALKTSFLYKELNNKVA